MLITLGTYRYRVFKSAKVLKVRSYGGAFLAPTISLPFSTSAPLGLIYFLLCTCISIVNHQNNSTNYINKSSGSFICVNYTIYLLKLSFQRCVGAEGAEVRRCIGGAEGAENLPLKRDSPLDCHRSSLIKSILQLSSQKIEMTRISVSRL